MRSYINLTKVFLNSLNVSPKRIYYSSKILEFKTNTKKTWGVMKEIIGKARNTESSLPIKLVIEKKEVTEIKDIAEKFNNFFTNVGPNIAKKVPNSSNSFTSFLNQTHSIMEKNSLSINELKETFFSLKTNKSPGYDDINFNVAKKCFGEINVPLKHLFNLLLENGIFHEKMKIAKVIPLFKNGDPENITNYRPISVLPCFSKVLERIMYNRVYKYLCEEKLLYSKQFGFQKGHSADHAIVHLVDQIYESFENDNYTIGVFIDLSKAFDTVDHSILLKKLEMYGVNTTNLTWFASYLNCRKQYVKIAESADTFKKDIKCGVPQGPILGPLLFLLYVNDLPNSSNVLVPIMFADDTNFFFEHSNINTLFKTVNHELIKIKEWFSANKLSLNVGKTKFLLFHKSGKKYSIPSHLPTLKINNHDIERVNTMKFLGVLSDDNLSWKEHIKILKIK